MHRSQGGLIACFSGISLQNCLTATIVYSKNAFLGASLSVVETQAFVQREAGPQPTAVLGRRGLLMNLCGDCLFAKYIGNFFLH